MPLRPAGYPGPAGSRPNRRQARHGTVTTRTPVAGRDTREGDGGGARRERRSAGIRADQQVSAGDVGTLEVIATTLGGAAGDIVANAGVTVTRVT